MAKYNSVNHTISTKQLLVLCIVVITEWLNTGGFISFNTVSLLCYCNNGHITTAAMNLYYSLDYLLYFNLVVTDSFRG